MGLHYDEKGKFFTDYVSKETFPALIQTTSNKIRGNVYLRTGERMSDMLNRSEHFIAVTDARIYDSSGHEIQACEFLAVNIDMIIWLLPDGTRTESQETREAPVE